MYVTEAKGHFTGIAGSTDLLAGELCYFDGTDWERANAADNTKFAEAVAVVSVKSGDVAMLCTECLIVDIDAPYTQGAEMYLSAATAGAITATRPTGADDLRQVVGFALSTSIVRIAISIPREYYIHVPVVATVGGTDAALDSGNFGSKAVDAQNDAAYASFVVPENFVELKIVYLFLAAEASAGTPTFDLFVSGAADGEQWDAATQDSGIADSAAEGAAPDELQRTDVTAGFDSADIMQIGNLVMAKINKDDTGIDSTNFSGFTVVYLGV